MSVGAQKTKTRWRTNRCASAARMGLLRKLLSHAEELHVGSIHLAANFATRKVRCVDIEIPQTAVKLIELLGDGEPASTVRQRHTASHRARGATHGSKWDEPVDDARIGAAWRRPMVISVVDGAPQTR